MPVVCTQCTAAVSGVGDSGERAERSATMIPLLSFPILQKPSLSGRALPSKVASAWEEAIAPPTGITVHGA